MGRTIKRIAAATLATGILLIFLPPLVVLAAEPNPPDDIAIKSVCVTSNITEAGDFVLAFHYRIHYDGDEPDEAADELFIFSLIDADGETELGAVLPYPYYPLSGYDQGVSGFFFDATDAPDWEEEYILRIAGNPGKFASPPEVNYYMASTDYYDSGNQTENQEYLGDYIIAKAKLLTINWDITLVTDTDAGTVLSETGESYFRSAIPGLQVMCPDIFWIRATPPEFEYREWGEEQATTYIERYEDTWVGDALDDTGDLFGVERTLITGGFILAAMATVMVVSQVRFTTTTPGLIAGGIIFLCGSVMGFVHMAMMAIVAILFALYVGYILFFKPS